MNYKNLFDHLANQHNLILTEQEMIEIENIILESNMQRINNEFNLCIGFLASRITLDGFAMVGKSKPKS